MRLQLQIVNASDFIKTTAVGKLDIAASIALLQRICTAAREAGDYHLMIDLRRSYSAMSLTDVWQMAEQMRSCAEAFRGKTVLLVAADGNLEQAAFFELSAQNRGFELRVFTDFEDAIYWLGSVETLEDSAGTGTGATQPKPPPPV